MRAIHDDGAETRALINATEMARLREENSGLKLSATLQSQTSTILNAQGDYFLRPAYNPCGCGCYGA